MINKLKYFSLGFLTLFLLACNSGEPSGPTEGTEAFVYSNITPSDKQAVQNEITSRNLSPESVKVVKSEFMLNSKHQSLELRLYEYNIESQTRYGLVALPENYLNENFPIVIFLDGLNQNNLKVDAKDLLNFYPYNAPDLEKFITVIPVFRGMNYQDGDKFESEGNFCDAYDGAADDAITLLNLVTTEVPEANASNTLVIGASRGGNVAHLVGQRDERVSMVVAISGPTDFYRKSVASHYKEQYQCQFFSGFNTEQAKRKILSSSPIHFVEHSPITRIHHAEKDRVVPVWNATEMYEALVENGSNARMYLYTQGNHSNFLSINNSFSINLKKDVELFLTTTN